MIFGGQIASSIFASEDCICHINSSVLIFLYLHLAILTWLWALRWCCQSTVLLTVSTVVVAKSLLPRFRSTCILDFPLCWCFFALWMSQKHGGVLFKHYLWCIVWGLYCLSKLTISRFPTPYLSYVVICFGDFLLHGVQIAYFLGIVQLFYSRF